MAGAPHPVQPGEHHPSKQAGPLPVAQEPAQKAKQGMPDATMAKHGDLTSGKGVDHMMKGA